MKQQQIVKESNFKGKIACFLAFCILATESETDDEKDGIRSVHYDIWCIATVYIIKNPHPHKLYNRCYNRRMFH